MAGISYILLGWGDSERSGLCAHFLRLGIDIKAQPVAVVTAPEHLEAVRVALSEEQLDVSLHTFTVDALPAVELPPDAHVFWIPDGFSDPRDFLEAIRGWIEGRGDDLGRIITIVDCELQDSNPTSHGFYDLCLHFSDVVLLGNRQNVSKKAVQAYRDHLRKSAIPSRVEFLRAGGKTAAPHELLFPEARRLSLYFDPEESYSTSGYEMEGLSLKTEEGEPDPRDPQSDPFLERTPEGRRRKVLHLPS